jgi:ubiE/COQ5 methyltransferase family
MARAELDKRPGDVAAMFDAIAGRYDLLNDLLSMGQVRLWRRAVARITGAGPGERVLDLAAGTGTSSLTFTATGADCVACDFSLGMLSAGRARLAGPGGVRGGGQPLPRWVRGDGSPREEEQGGSGGDRSPRASTVRRELRVIAAILVGVTVLMLAAGTVVTGTGPLAGDAGVPRYQLPLEGVTQLHADIGWLLAGLSIAMVLGLRLSGAPRRAVRAGWIMLAALGSQGVIGYIQYFTHLPAGLVWVHVTGSVLVWIAVLRLFFIVREREPVNTARTGTAVAVPSRQPEPLDL